MTSQAKTSSIAALASVPSTASPALATPQFITSLVQSMVQANTTSLLSQLDRRIAAALKAQGAVSNAPGREIQQPAQHQAPPPITSAPVAPVSTTPSQNVPGEHACGDSSVRYDIDGEISAQFQVMPAAAGSEELRASKPSVAANETCINGSIYLIHPGVGAMAPACSLANIALFMPNSSTVPVQAMSHSSMSLLNPTVTTANAPTVAMEAANKLPVLISPNAPPIPFETCEWIWKGQYVDMAELLPEACTEMQNEKDKNRYKGEVKSILAWTECFLAYIAIVVKQDSARVPNLLAYSSLIISAARCFKRNGWQVYDANFRSQAAANSLTVWAQTNSLLWTTIFSTAEAVNHCTHCLSVDHMSEECHKNSRSKKLFNEDAGSSTSRTQARHVIQPICKSWNYRPYAIDVITQITKRETDGGRKFRYYAAILSGKNGRGLRSLSTAKHFASSFLTSAGNDFAFTPRMR